jgi:hypothetical protein
MMPTLIYLWGSTFHLLVSELEILEKFTNQHMGKLMTVEVGRLVFEVEEKAQVKGAGSHACHVVNVIVTCVCSARD